MSKIISVATSYTMYEVEDNIFEILSGGDLVQPAAIVLEVMAMNNQARRVGMVSTATPDGGLDEPTDEDDPAEGEGPWLSEDE
jgi:hypothetical protein